MAGGLAAFAGHGDALRRLFVAALTALCGLNLAMDEETLDRHVQSVPWSEVGHGSVHQMVLPLLCRVVPQRPASVETKRSVPGGSCRKPSGGDAITPPAAASKAPSPRSRRCGLRRSRYIGLNKARLHHVLTAALNLIRTDAWRTGAPLASTRTYMTQVRPHRCVPPAISSSLQPIRGLRGR